MILAVFSGIAGSALSILYRLGDFEKAEARSRDFYYYTGLFAPSIGMILSIVSVSILKSQLLNINFTNDASESTSFYIVIGFLSGFSERFTTGLLRRIEGVTSQPSFDRNERDGNPEPAPSADADGKRTRMP
jgi:hypothetical protein